MATRSTIGILKNDGSVRYVKCFYDGGIEGVGWTLLAYWKDRYDVEDLIEKGDMSSLGQDLNSTDFYQFRPNEKGRNHGPKTVSENEYFLEEFNYLYKNGKWFVNGQPLKNTM